MTLLLKKLESLTQAHPGSPRILDQKYINIAHFLKPCALETGPFLSSGKYFLKSILSLRLSPFPIKLKLLKHCTMAKAKTYAMELETPAVRPPRPE